MSENITILGGGQLARMLIQAGVPLGANFKVADTKEDVCAAVEAKVTAVDWANRKTLEALARETDIFTFDYENVPADTAKVLQQYAQVSPNPDALATAQDRLTEKSTFRAIGIPTADFVAVDTKEQLTDAIKRIGTPAILKTRRMGYDGKGQFRLKTPQDVEAAWHELGETGRQYGLILEAFVPFDYEVSVLAVRNHHGEFKTWPLTRNWHDNGILSMSLAPASVSQQVSEKAITYAQKLAKELDYVGVFALELFVVDNQVMGNEMAPRVHNSGHWTIDGAITSQFENHIRAILNMPLGDTNAKGVSVMFNWIGELPSRNDFLSVTDSHWHDYQKAPRPGRKVGHASVCAKDMRTLYKRVELAAERSATVSKAQGLLDALQSDISSEL